MRSSQRITILLAQTAVLMLALTPSACKEDDGRTTYDIENCDEPAFEYPEGPNYAPCGCGSRYGEPRTDWEQACYDAGVPGWDDFTCLSDTKGGTCIRKCTTDAECPPLDGWPAVCRLPSGLCEVPCEHDNYCPVGMHCGLGSCSWTFVTD